MCRISEARETVSKSGGGGKPDLGTFGAILSHGAGPLLKSPLYLALPLERPQAKWPLLFPVTCIITITEFTAVL